MRWRLFVAEYGPTIRYVEGAHNVVADTLSRIDIVNLDVDQEPMKFCFQIKFHSNTFLLTKM